MTSTQNPMAAAPWHAAYPAPRNTKPEALTKEQVLALLQGESGGTIRGSINVPAQSLYPTIPTLYTLWKAAGIRTVIWYCGSSGGRGTRAAGWFSDYITDQEDQAMKSVILAGGIKGWATAGAAYTEWMDGYDAEKWRQYQAGTAQPGCA